MSPADYTCGHMTLLTPFNCMGRRKFSVTFFHFPCQSWRWQTPTPQERLTVYRRGFGLWW